MYNLITTLFTVLFIYLLQNDLCITLYIRNIESYLHRIIH